MLKLKAITSAVAASALALALIPAESANAAVTYTYVGPNFNVLVPDASVSTHFTTSDHITGTVTFSAPLAANLPLTSEIANLTDFTFSAGPETLTKATANFLTTFEISTDASGNITGWLINIGKGGYGSLFLEGGDGTPRDQAVLSPTERGQINGQGTFTQAAVPEPASWALMIGGLGLTGAALRRRARKTTVAFA